MGQRVIPRATGWRFWRRARCKGIRQRFCRRHTPPPSRRPGRIPGARRRARQRRQACRAAGRPCAASSRRCGKRTVSLSPAVVASRPITWGRVRSRAAICFNTSAGRSATSTSTRDTPATRRGGGEPIRNFVCENLLLERLVLLLEFAHLILQPLRQGGHGVRHGAEDHAALATAAAASGDSRPRRAARTRG